MTGCILMKGMMITFKIVTFIMLFSEITFKQVSGMTCEVNNDSLHICNGSHSYFKPTTSKQIKIGPLLTFFSLANLNPYEQTITVFASLTLKWNDPRINIKRDRYNM